MIEIQRDSVIQRYQWSNPADALKTFLRWHSEDMVTEAELQSLIVELALQMPEEAWGSE
jgi:hypothetical protein